jgi:16S rRNA (cytidine1402-2'-O)-methyltransferase
MNKTIYIVATPIGNLGDLTFRALEVLKSVDCILAEDTRRTKILLDHYGVKTKMISFHKFNENKRLLDIESIFNEYSRIALVSDAGTPLVSDPGAPLVEYALNNHISIVPIPGPSALTALLSASGISTSQNRVTFIGFLPHTENGIRSEIGDLISDGDPFIFFDSPKRVGRTIKIVSEMDPEASVVIGRELTKIHEEIIRFKASTPPDKITDKGEFTVLIQPKNKKSNKNRLVNKNMDSKSETKKLAILLANYLNLQVKEAYSMLIKLKENASSKD